MSDNDSSANNPQDQNSDAHVTSGDWLKAADLWWQQTLSEAGAGFRARLDAEAQNPPKPPDDPAPLTAFDQDFRQLVPPKLEGYLRLGAYLVSLGLENFSEAHDRVMRVARRLGASHLSETAFWTFDTWIDQQLMACIDEPPPEGVVTLEQLARIVREVPR